MAFAAAQNREGKKDLSEFICNQGGKVVDKCLAVALELSTAEEKYTRRQKSCLQLPQEMKDANCNGQWLQAACTLLQKKWNCSKRVFHSSVYVIGTREGQVQKFIYFWSCQLWENVHAFPAKGNLQHVL